jgi:hypothetical protein
VPVLGVGVGAAEGALGFLGGMVSVGWVVLGDSGIIWVPRCVVLNGYPNFWCALSMGDYRGDYTLWGTVWVIR